MGHTERFFAYFSNKFSENKMEKRTMDNVTKKESLKMCSRQTFYQTEV